MKKIITSIFAATILLTGCAGNITVTEKPIEETTYLSQTDETVTDVLVHLMN